MGPSPNLVNWNKKEKDQKINKKFLLCQIFDK